MKNKKINENCPVSHTLHIIGGKYKALLLWHLTDQTLRFGDLQRLVPEATPKMLTQQLRELEGDGLILRTVYPVVPPKVEYQLTDLGKSLFPILQAMYTWGSTRMETSGQTPHCTMSVPCADCKSGTEPDTSADTNESRSMPPSAPIDCP